jgi:shikimate kinase
LIFRDAEFKALKSLLVPAGAAGQGPVRVIAAGGGIIDNPPAMACAAQAEGILLVCLELSPETAWKRICRAAEQTKEMPLFLMTENPRETHRALHERRAAAYRQIAGMVVLAERATAETTAREIVKRFQEYS